MQHTPQIARAHAPDFAMDGDLVRTCAALRMHVAPRVMVVARWSRGVLRRRSLRDLHAGTRGTVPGPGLHDRV